MNQKSPLQHRSSSVITTKQWQRNFKIADMMFVQRPSSSISIACAHRTTTLSLKGMRCWWKDNVMCVGVVVNQPSPSSGNWNPVLYILKMAHSLLEFIVPLFAVSQSLNEQTMLLSKHVDHPYMTKQKADTSFIVFWFSLQWLSLRFWPNLNIDKGTNYIPLSQSFWILTI